MFAFFCWAAIVFAGLTVMIGLAVRDLIRGEIAASGAVLSRTKTPVRFWASIAAWLLPLGAFWILFVFKIANAFLAGRFDLN